MENNNYYDGDWTDSNGDIYHVRYKKKWGTHEFTKEQIDDLLAGKEITFTYTNGKKTTGHFQYYTYNGKECFGFRPNYGDDYVKEPVGHSSDGSLFVSDLQKEKIMAEYMRLYYYARLLNDDGTPVQDFQRIEDKNRQKQGIDVTYTRNGIHYVIDEKAQMDYIENSLKTFSLELLNVNSGNIGWFVNDELETEYYMFIWPYGRKPQSVDDIEYADYALVKKETLLSGIEEKLHKTPERLLEYAKQLTTRNIGKSYEVEKKWKTGTEGL